MQFTSTALLTLLASALVSGQLGGVGSEKQQKDFAKDLVSAIQSYKNSPEATSLLKEVSSYLTGSPAQVTQNIQAFAAANLPANPAQFTQWVSNPLIYATQGPQPEFVQAMPTNVRNDYLKAQYSQLQLAASLAKKNFDLAKSTAPVVTPGLGWLASAVAGVIGAAAVVL